MNTSPGANEQLAFSQMHMSKKIRILEYFIRADCGVIDHVVEPDFSLFPLCIFMLM